MSGIISPSLLGLFIGKAFATFKRDTYDTSTIHLGKLTDIEYTPKVTIAEYYDESQGISILADAAVQQVGGEGKITLNELTMYNLGLLISGDPDYTTPTAPQVPIYGIQTPITGALTIVGTNGKGPRVRWNITRALITSGSEAFKPITKEYGTIPLQFKHLADDGNQFGYIDQLPDANTIAPTNFTAPFITGLLTSSSPAVPAGGTPAVAKLGGSSNLLTVNIGQWTAGNIGVKITYQWYFNASNANTGGSIISGATSKTYTPVGNHGDYLYCVVTIANSIGSTAVPSGTTQAIIS